MAEQLTPQQAQAVTDRGGPLLVSAAAGSGKTKVLVDRLMRYLTDPADPANLDDFLMITYTKAAAGELREKISAKLTERIAENPEDRHLQAQVQRLYLAQISTVHSFCADLLKQYAFQVDLPGDFRMAEEDEAQQLRQLALNRVLENAYKEPEDSLRAFLDTQGLGRDDRRVPEILLDVYNASICHLDPEGWLDACVAGANPEAVTDAGQTVWGKFLMDSLLEELSQQISVLERCIAQAEAAQRLEKVAETLRAVKEQYERLREARTWDEVHQNRGLVYPKLIFPRKDYDRDLADRLKALWDPMKKAVADKLIPFADSSAQVLEDLASGSAAVLGLVKLVRAFSAEYARRKKARRVLDFSDLEHRTLDLLTGKQRDRVTAVAEQVGAGFREIMVDEYQDSNPVQDKIFAALTARRGNRFMVGDVKQSIYRFRLADPSIFLQKYNTYAPAGEAAPGAGRKILLSSNFRSCAGVLEGANDLFRLCMTPEVGGLTYGPQEALVEGIPHEPLGEPEVELLVMDAPEEKVSAEAELVAGRIAELIDGTHFVRGKEGLRPITPGDIAILLRAPSGSGASFQAALEKRGIPCCFGGGDNLLEAPEIQFLRALLQIIANPRRDIALLTVLTDPCFGFHADELAALRAADPTGDLYDALTAWDSPKARQFTALLGRLRQWAVTHTLAQLLDQVFLETGLDSLYGAMEGGSLRLARLREFYRLAVAFESTSRRDLNQFLDSLAASEARGLKMPEQEGAPNAVSIVSIHKSKGLEYPVVFVSGLTKQFNRQDQDAPVLCDKALGLGLMAVDPANRYRYPTAAKRAIAAKIAQDSRSEELRVLYVALTRARDRLIMTYVEKNPEKKLASLAYRMDLCGPELLSSKANSLGHWVLMAALRRTEAGALFAIGGKPQETTVSDHPWRIRVENGPEAEVTEPTALKEASSAALSPEDRDLLKAGLAFRYPHAAATLAPAKQTPTQRKGRPKDAEVAENAPEPPRPQTRWPKPRFAGGTPEAAAAGTATHLCLQYLRYQACTDADAVAKEVRRLVNRRFLTEEQGKLIPCQAIAQLFASPLGQRMLHCPKVLREFKFSLLDPGEHTDPSLAGEQILLQGMVDCALLEPDGITVIDFKTDFVTEETLEQKVAFYRPQVAAYAQAMARIFGQPVKESILYFFRLNRAVSLPGLSTLAL